MSNPPFSLRERNYFLERFLDFFLEAFLDFFLVAFFLEAFFVDFLDFLAKARAAVVRPVTVVFEVFLVPLRFFVMTFTPLVGRCR
jgi:hypothetical protein